MTLTTKLLAILIALSIITTQSSQQQTPARSPCPNAIKINTNYQYRGGLHFICLQATSSRPRLDVIQYSNLQLIGSLEVNEVGTNQLSSFVDDEGNLRVMVAAPNRINGTSVYSIDQSGQFLEDKHTINTQLVRTMNIWKLELNWQWQLATANGPVIEYHHERNAIPPPDPKPIISIHSWRATYFDQYQLIYLPYDGRVNKLEPMHINDQEFLIVAMAAHGHDPHVPSRSQLPALARSLIYKLDFSDGTLNWIHYQDLNTELALDASSFSISHRGSLQRDYYIAMIGQPQARSSNNGLDYRLNNTNSPLDAYGLIIYKYLGDQFYQVHSIPVPGATKLDTISYGVGDTYVIIAILNGWTNQISLYLYDGLNLKPIPGPTSVAPPSGVSLYPQRQRRTMNVEQNLHLFMIPPAGDAFNDTNVKRTLGDDSQLVTMPALAFSNPIQAANMDNRQDNVTGYMEPINNQATLYEIPVRELTRADQQSYDNEVSPAGANEDAGYTKRNFIDIGQNLFSWCKSKIDELTRDNFDATLRQLRTLPRVNQDRPIEVTGNLIIDGNLHVTNLLYANRIEEQRDLQRFVVPPNRQPVNFTQTFWDIERAHQKIDSIKERVDQILVDDGSIQEVFSPQSFESVVFECLNPINMDPRLQPMQLFSGSCPIVNEVQTSVLNLRHNISDIRQQALLTGRSMTIAKDVRFEHLVLRGTSHILQTLNNIPINEIVFGRGPPIGLISGEKNFANGLYSTANLQVDLWHDQPVDRQTVLTSSGEQRIDAGLRFSGVILDSARGLRSPHNVSTHFERLNNYNLGVHLGQIALANDDNTFEVPIHFEELILNGPVQLTANSYLSDLNLESLWLNTMFKQTHQNILAPIEFLGDVHVSYGGDIIVNGSINGVILNQDNVMMRNRNYDLPNPVVFDGDLKMGAIEVLRGLNEIQALVNFATNRYELALLMDGGPQYLSGDKILNEVHLGGQSHIYGLINGHLNVTQLHHLATSHRNDEPFRFSTVRITGQDVRIATGVDVHIGSLINGIHVNALCDLALRASQMKSNQYRRLRFDQDVKFRSLRCASINGFNNLTHSFLTKSGVQHVAGTLRLINGIVLNTTLNIGSTLNGMSVAPLSQAIAKAINETRTGHKDIYGDFFVDDLVAERINDLQLSNVFITKSDYPQIIRAPIRFDHLDIENILIIGRDLITNSFNSLNVTDIISNTLQYDTPQVIYNHVELQSLHLLAGANLITKSVNGYDMQRLYSDAVLYDVPQQILAPKTFRAPVYLNDRVFIQHGIDGLTQEELKFNLLLQSDELIDDDLQFANPVTIMKELEIQSGVINDIDINSFVNSILFENGKGMRIVGNSSVRFKDVQLNNLVTTGTIQGIDFSRDAVRQSEWKNGTTRMPHQWPKHSQPPYQVYSTIMVTPLPPRPVQLPTPSPLVYTRPQVFPQYPKQLHLNPRPLGAPLGLINSTQLQTVWRPDYHGVQAARPLDSPTALIDPNYEEHKALVHAAAMRDLISRVNRFLSVSFYYEIVQKHPLLGPLLHAADNPIQSEEGRALLMLKATSKQGEPCLQRGQTIAVMAQQRLRNPSGSSFTLDSRIQETSNPSLVQSLVVGGSHYLFILDSYAEGSIETVSQVLIYIWDYRQGMYELKQRKVVDGFPTAMKAFVVNNLGCLALANPRLVFANHSSGAPMLHCQQSPLGDFNQQILLPLQNVFDLDVVTLPTNSEFIIAALAQQDTEQIGDLIVGVYNFNMKLFRASIIRRTVRPLKVHFVKRPRAASFLHLVVSEAITSSDDARAITRIFTLPFVPNMSLMPASLGESQLIKDNQFYDIQSVYLDSMHPILFLQSAHSISIYAPIGNNYPGCEFQFNLIQRLPTKGANRFLVFNSNSTTQVGPQGHFLVLSRDDCEHQQYSTLILKAKFK